MSGVNQEPVRHIVFFSLHPVVSDSLCAEALDMLHQLGQGESDIQEWTVAESIDTRKGRIIVENGLFSSSEALKTFQHSDKHQRAAEFMKTISDWLVGDYVEPAH